MDHAQRETKRLMDDLMVQLARKGFLFVGIIAYKEGVSDNESVRVGCGRAVQLVSYSRNRKMKHTHRTDFIRSDYQLAALHVLIAFNGQEPTPEAIESWEGRFRGNQQFEASLDRAAAKLQQIAPDFKAETHNCNGQLCDQDGAYDVSIVKRKD